MSAILIVQMLLILIKIMKIIGILFLQYSEPIITGEILCSTVGKKFNSVRLDLFLCESAVMVVVFVL